MQPTDQSVRSVFVISRGHGNPLEGTRWVPSSARSPGRGGRATVLIDMKTRLLQLFATMASIAAVLLAGGASLRGFYYEISPPSPVR